MFMLKKKKRHLEKTSNIKTIKNSAKLYFSQLMTQQENFVLFIKTKQNNKNNKNKAKQAKAILSCWNA